jgi:uncharacterized protein (DUF2062 family)
MTNQLIRRKITDPLAAFFKAGVSAKKMALGIAMGFTLGIFPVIGLTTLLGVLAAFLFRLNLPIIQLANYLVYPLQIALLIPTYHLGALVFGVEPLPISATELIYMFETDLWGTFGQLGGATVRAIAVWVLLCPLAVLVLYMLIHSLLNRFSSGFKQSSDANHDL